MHRLRDHSGRLGEQFGLRSEQQAQAVRHASLRGDVADKALHPFLQRDIRPFAARQLVGGRAQQFHLAPIDHFDQMLARGEMAIQRSNADAGAPCDLFERGLDTMLGKG